MVGMEACPETAKVSSGLASEESAIIIVALEQNFPGSIFEAFDWAGPVVQNE